MKKLNRTHWELIVALVVLIIATIIVVVEKDKSYTRGYKVGLQRENDDCNTKIKESIQTIQEDAKKKSIIFNESPSDAKRRFDSLFPPNPRK